MKIVQFSTQKVQTLETLIQRHLDANVFPGIEILFALGQDVLLHRAWGHLETGDQAPPLTLNTLFDIASLTKPIATATAMMLLQEQGLLDFEEKVCRFLPELNASPKNQISIKALLTHTSGLPDWENLYENNKNKDEAWKQLVNIPLRHAPGTQTIYSCLGYLLLGEIIRRVSHQSLTEFFQAHIAGPLNLKHTLFSPLRQTKPLPPIAPTQYCPYRKCLLRGRVHDENSYIFNEEGGNAGLFSTAEDLHRYCLMVLNEGELEGNRLLSPLSIRAMLHNHNTPPLLPRGLGWDFKERGFGYWSCGDLAPSGTVGHTGFTGTSLWMHPRLKTVMIVLSNRVHISRENQLETMRLFRARLHNLLFSQVT
ncbi:serine hydrolase domain-containing protein [Deltaproteobacteria bacterium TL4]